MIQELYEFFGIDFGPADKIEPIEV